MNQNSFGATLSTFKPFKIHQKLSFVEQLKIDDEFQDTAK